MKKKLALIGAFLAVLALTLPAALSASAATHVTHRHTVPHRHASLGVVDPICTSKAPNYCLDEPGIETDAGVWNDLYGWEQSEELGDGVCDGYKVTVSPACPFTNGSGLNSEFVGKDIVLIQFNQSNGLDDVCAGANDSFYVITRNCPGLGSDTTGTEWVVDGDKFINVYNSDQNGAETVMTGDGTLNDPVINLKSPNANYTNWVQ